MELQYKIQISPNLQTEGWGICLCVIERFMKKLPTFTSRQGNNYK